jgi:hypothetical protein
VQAYAARARTRGDDVTVVAAPGVSHTGVVVPAAAPWPTVWGPIRAFLGRL